MNDNLTSRHVPTFDVLNQAFDTLTKILQHEIDAIKEQSIALLDHTHKQKIDLCNFLEAQKIAFKKLALIDHYTKSEVKTLAEKSATLEKLSRENAMAIKTASLINAETIEIVSRAIAKLTLQGRIYSAKGEAQELRTARQTYGYEGEL